MTRSRIRVAVLVVVAAVVVVALPGQISPYQLDLATQILIFAALAASLDLVVGYTGLPSLGHAAFFGTSAYAVGLLTMKGEVTNLWLNLLVGVVAAVALAAIVGPFLLRTSKAYFLLLSLAIGQVVWGVAFGWRSVTGGDDGLSGLPRPGWSLPGNLYEPSTFFWFVAGVALPAIGVAWFLARSRFGLRLQGIRENERRMAVLGYRTFLTKYVALLVSAGLAGLAGCLFAYYNGFVGPGQLNVVQSAEILLMVIIGGPGTILGPVLGAGALVGLERWVSGLTERWVLVLGIVYIVTAIAVPSGLAGLYRRAAARWRHVTPSS